MTNSKDLGTPLEGIRMLDLGRYQAGPRCALMFARMGAEVIKVESIEGEDGRNNPPLVRGQSAYWVQYNSGKKSLAIDLRTEKGKEIIIDLVKVSDFFLQNFRPGTIEKMGFGYDVLQNLNPKIIMINVSAYGQYGPHRDKVGFDTIGQAMGGLMSLTGYEGLPPIRSYFPLIDRITSLHATIGALAALREREISGKGQSLEVCLADTGFTANEIPISAYLGDGVITKREPRDGSANPLRGAVYETADGYVNLIAPNDTMWKRICQALKRPEWLENPRFKTRADRQENGAVIRRELESWFKTRNTKEAVDYLSSFSIPCAAVNDTAQAANEPHLHEREIMMEVPDPVAGTMWVTGKTIKFSRTPMVVGSTPMIGQHSKEVLRDILDYSEDRIQALVDEEVVAVG